MHIRASRGCPPLVLLCAAAITVVTILGRADAAPPDPASLRNRAAALLDNGEDEKAIAVFRDLVKRLPSSVPERVNLGIALLNHNDMDGAEAELRKAAEMDPKDARAHYNLGLVLKRRGKNEEAATHLATAAADPEGVKDAAVHYNLGVVYKRLRKGDEALAEFRKAVALRPEHASAHFQIYNELVQRGDKSQAQPELELFKLLKNATPEFQRTESYLERGAFTRIAAPGPLVDGGGGAAGTGGSAGGVAASGGNAGGAAAAIGGAGEAGASGSEAVAIRFALAARVGGVGAGGGGSGLRGGAARSGGARVGGEGPGPGNAVTGGGGTSGNGSLATGERASASVALADFDGDGSLDLAYAVTSAGPVRIVRQGSAGAFVTVLVTLELPKGASSTGRGDPAASEARSGGQQPVPGGQPARREETTASTLALAASDVDNDGDQDLVVAGAGGVALYLNDGKGQLLEATKGSGLEGTGGAGDAAWLDADRDGDLDLVLGAGGGGDPRPRLLLNAAVYPANTGVASSGPASPTAAANATTSAAAPPNAGTSMTMDGQKLARKGAAPAAATRAEPHFIPAGGDAVLPACGDRLAYADLAGHDDQDLVFVCADGTIGIARNLRAARFQSERLAAGSGPARSAAQGAGAPQRDGPALRLRAGDLDNDGRSDLVFVAAGALAVLWNEGDGVLGGPVRLAQGLPAGLSALALLDADGDGDLDVVTLAPGGASQPRPGAAQTGSAAGSGSAGSMGNAGRAPGAGAESGVGSAGGTGAGSSSRVLVVRNDGARRFTAVSDVAPELAAGAGDLASGDLNGDGAPDLALAAAPSPLVLLNTTKGPNRFMRVALTSGKSNRSGVGARIEVRADRLVVTRQSDGNPVIVGIGPRGRVDAVQVVWPTGVSQDLVDVPAGALRVDEKREFAGSCPFLYAWDGTTFRFTGEALSGAPVGFLRSDGVFEKPRPREHLRLPAGLPVAHGGRLALRMTEEMRELTALDSVRLVAVDHPAGTEVYSNERLREVEEPFGYIALAELRPPAAAAEVILDGAEDPEATSGRAEQGVSGASSRAALLRLDERAAEGFATLGSRLEGLATAHALLLQFDAVDPDPGAVEQGGAPAGRADAPRSLGRAPVAHGTQDQGTATEESRTHQSPGRANPLALVLDGWVAWTTSDVSRALLQASEARKAAHEASQPRSWPGAASEARERAGEADERPGKEPLRPGEERSSERGVSPPGAGPRSFAGRPLPEGSEPWGPAMEVRAAGRAFFEPDLGLPVGPSMVAPLTDIDDFPPRNAQRPLHATGTGAGALRQGDQGAGTRPSSQDDARSGPAPEDGRASGGPDDTSDDASNGKIEIRIGTNLAVYYDRIRLGQILDAPLKVHELAPLGAELRWRGVAASRRHDDASPPRPDYDDVSPLSPFRRLAETTTAEGDVLSLVGEADGRMVVFGTGEEVALEFDATAAPPPGDGFERTWFLVSYGFARDGDPNTEPLPWGP